MGKLPDFLPNKPTVVGSRGQNPGSGMISKYGANSPGEGARLPTLASSGGIAANSLINKNSPGGLNNKLSSMNNMPVYKYNSGIGIGGGGIGGINKPGGQSYGMNY